MLCGGESTITCPCKLVTDVNKSCIMRPFTLSILAISTKTYHYFTVRNSILLNPNKNVKRYSKIYFSTYTLILKSSTILQNFSALNELLTCLHATK